MASFPRKVDHTLIKLQLAILSCNLVLGCPFPELVASGMIASDQDPSECFISGQVVKCRVMKCQPRKKKLQLSLQTEGEMTPVSSRPHVAEAISTSMLPGHVVTGTVSAVEKGCLLVKVDTDDKPVVGKLDAAHLTDHPSHSSKLFEVHKARFESGTQEKLTLVVLSFDKKAGTPIFSLKPTLLQAG